MGFYTTFYNKRKGYRLISGNFTDEHSAKWAGGYQLWKWCWNNIEEKYIKNDDEYGYFIITQGTLMKMIKENAMGENNTNHVLKKLLSYLKKNNLTQIYFEGDY